MEVDKKTRIHVSQRLAIMTMLVFGSVGAVAFILYGTIPSQNLFFPNHLSTTSNRLILTDHTKDQLPVPSTLTPEAFAAAKAADTVQVMNSGVAIGFTDPTEGAIVTGNTPVTVKVVDPQQQVVAVRFETFNDRLRYHFVWSSDAIAPYTMTPNLGLYPSGEYRHVALALNSSGAVLATADIMVTFAHSCYYLAPQDLHLTGPITPIVAGTTFAVAGTLTNHMRGNCPHIYTVDTFDAVTSSSLLPDGWSAVIAPPSPLILDTEETKVFTMTVMVPPTTPAGTYTIGAFSQLQYTGFNVNKQLDVVVKAASTTNTNQ